MPPRSKPWPSPSASPPSPPPNPNVGYPRRARTHGGTSGPRRPFARPIFTGSSRVPSVTTARTSLSPNQLRNSAGISRRISQPAENAENAGSTTSPLPSTNAVIRWLAPEAVRTRTTG